jgi:hypothetical protein
MHVMLNQKHFFPEVLVTKLEWDKDVNTLQNHPKRNSLSELHKTYFFSGKLWCLFSGATGTSSFGIESMDKGDISNSLSPYIYSPSASKTAKEKFLYFSFDALVSNVWPVVY